MNIRKDEKVQVYKTVVQVVGTREVKYRKYIYSEDIFYSGGLWANARGLLSSEVMSSGLSFEQDYVQFTLNRNKKIDKTCKIIYRNDIYDIESIDPMDFRAIDFKVKARKSVDNTVYSGEIFDE